MPIHLFTLHSKIRQENSTKEVIGSPEVREPTFAASAYGFIVEVFATFRAIVIEQSNARVNLVLKKAYLGFFLALIVLGMFLRFVKIRDNSLWIDEIYMLITAKRTFWDGILQLEDYSPPIYQLVLRIVSHNPFPSEVIMRLPAVFFGCLTIPAAWWFARTLFGSKLALIVAALIALNPMMIHYSREARPYTLFTLTAILSMTFFFRLMNEDKWMNAGGYAFTTILLVYSHFYGFLVFAAQLIYLILDRFAQRGADKRKSLPAMTFVFLFSLPSAWLACRYVISGAQGIMGGWMPSYGLVNGIRVFGELIFGQQAMGGLFVIPIIAAVWPGESAFDYRNSSYSSIPITKLSSLWQQRAPAVLCALWVLLSIYPLILASYVYRPVFQPKYALPTVLPLITIAIVFMWHFNRGVIVLGIAVLLAISAPKIYSELRPVTGMRELVALVNQNVGDKEKVYTLHAPYCEGYINPGETALRYYGYRGGEPERLPLVWDLNSVKINAPSDPLPREKRSYIVSMVGGKEVELFLNRNRRTYQVQAPDTMTTLFIIEPTEKSE